VPPYCHPASLLRVRLTMSLLARWLGNSVRKKRPSRLQENQSNRHPDCSHHGWKYELNGIFRSHNSSPFLDANRNRTEPCFRPKSGQNDRIPNTRLYLRPSFVLSCYGSSFDSSFKLALTDIYANNSASIPVCLRWWQETLSSNGRSNLTLMGQWPRLIGLTHP
jgi:hypothetical protein